MRAPARAAVLAALVLVGACTPPERETSAADGPAATAASTPPPIPDGPLGTSIRRGRAILLATADSLPDHVGNDLRCTSCHLDEGRRPGAMPWTGVYARFPQYRSREAVVFRIEDRINGCLRRSMNGRALPLDDPRMRDMVAYMAHLSRGVAVGDTVAGQGLARLDPPLAGDRVRGRAVWVAQCARCHADDGAGTAQGPPVWGPRSFNVGAGMTRIRTAAAFVHANMPYDRPGTLTRQQAFDVAAYLTAQPRPDFPDKVHDWPNGDPPPDVAYRTTAGRTDTP